MTLNRRTFLKYQFHGMLWLSATAGGWLRPGLALGADRPDIAVAKGGAAAATRAAVELLGGMTRFVKKGSRVVIKPNMSFTSTPERASNTDPLVVQTVAAMCREAGAGQVLVLDNPLGSAERCLELSGIRAACDTLDRDMVHMVSKGALFEETAIPGAVTLSETSVMNAVLKADVLIAVPKAKSHSGAGVSLSMKGMMGLIKNRMVMHMMDLHEAIVDLASLLRPHLVVIDGTRVLSTGGPGGPGKVLKKDTVIASADMVAADAYAVSAFEWYGKRYRPDQVKHIRRAHERRLGRMDVDNLTIRSVSV